MPIAGPNLEGFCIYPFERDRVYLNTGVYFVDVAREVGLTRKIPSRGVALADFDNDGDLDMIISHQFAPPRLYRNDSEKRDWLGLRLVGDGVSCNRGALGTKLILRPGENLPTQRREVRASNGLSSQNEERILFGLGSPGKISSGTIRLEVDWCGLGKKFVYTLKTNTYHQISQEKSEQNQ